MFGLDDILGWFLLKNQTQSIQGKVYVHVAKLHSKTVSNMLILKDYCCESQRPRVLKDHIHISVRREYISI